MPDRNERPRTRPIASSYDVIVVGSGMGGLAAGSLLARIGKARVLLLERHYRFGGLLHEFSRPGGGRWSVGLHYVGEMGRESRFRRLMDLITGGVPWAPMPDRFERYIYPGLRVSQPRDEEEFVAELSDRWPRERSGILRYFATVRGAALQLRGGAAAEALPPGRSPGTSPVQRTTEQVLEACVRDDRLKAVLASQWGNYGLPPSRSAFVAHATTVRHYLEGGWVPVGGTRPLIEGAIAAIEDEGGDCRRSSEASSILTEDGRAAGVAVVAPGEDRPRVVRAPVVISAAGARTTYERLLRHQQSDELAEIRAWLGRLGPPYTVVQLFIRLREPAARLGVQGENLWLFDSFDHEETYRTRDDLLGGRASGAFVSFPSARDPLAQQHTAEILAPVSRESFRRWSGSSWKDRGGDYESTKARIADALLELAERHIPGITGATAYRELATPLTLEHFTGHAGGAAYGLPAVPERFGRPGASVATPVPGLLLAGSDASIHGVVGAMMGGVSAAARVLGPRGLERILSAAAASESEPGPSVPRSRRS